MNRKINLFHSHGHLYAAGAVAAVMLLAACQDDQFMDDRIQQVNNVCFAPVPPDEWNSQQQSRSGSVQLPVDTLYTLSSDSPGDPLYLHVTVNDGIRSGNGEATPDNGDVLSRGIQVTGADNFHSSIGVYACSYIGNFVNKANLMNNLKVGKAGGWTTDKQWPGASYKVRFYAYAPHKEDFGTNPSLTPNMNPSGEGLKLFYSMYANSDPRNMKDLMVAASGELAGDYRQPANMKFRHALAAIKIVTAADFAAGTISKIKFERICLTGNLFYNGTDLRWEQGTGGNSGEFDFISTDTKVGPNTNVLGSDKDGNGHVAFLIPCQFANAGTTVTVTYTPDGGQQTTKTFTLTGQWEAGKTYTYTISSTEEKPDLNFDYTFEVNENKDEVLLDYYSSTLDIPVKSIKTAKSGGKQENVNWTMRMSEDGNNWQNVTNISPITCQTMPGTGIGNGFLKATTSYSESPEWVNLEDQQLKNANMSSSSQSNPTDLSKRNNGLQSSANCYIVNRPGWYKLPLVYGNALKDGATNTSAWKSENGYGTQTYNGKLVDHSGQTFENPWIKVKFGSEITSAKIVWQDADNLLTNVSLDNKDYLKFYVDKNAICQGNAVVAVINAKGEALWSWHIWVTPYQPLASVDNFDNELSDHNIWNHDNQQFRLMAIPLGFCFGESKVWNKSTVYVELTQSETKQTKVLKVTRMRHTERRAGNTVTYQHGRKDPFPAGLYQLDAQNSTPNEQKTIYGGTIQVQNNAITTSNSIMHPDWIAYNGNGYTTWSSEYWINRWDMACKGDGDPMSSTKKVVKTIYDPSPYGYAVPTKAVFTGLTVDGNNRGTKYGHTNYLGWSALLRSSKEFYDNFGINFYVKPLDSNNKPTVGANQTFYLPTTGYRDHNNKQIRNVSKMGCYWMATYYAGLNRGYMMQFQEDWQISGDDFVMPCTDMSTSDGYAVIPVAE